MGEEGALVAESFMDGTLVAFLARKKGRNDTNIAADGYALYSRQPF
jgi:hypothetical protein